MTEHIEELEIRLSQYQQEVEALLTSARAILTLRDFEQAAPVIFEACKDVIGAQSGYVALLTPDGAENEILFLDAGGLPCTVEPELPMPIRGLRARAYQTAQVVYHNDFLSTDWVEFLPAGHVELENVLFAPLLVEGQAVGLLGLANKPTGFTEADAQIAAGFGEIAAVALLNSRTLASLEASEMKFHTLFDNAADAILIHDLEGHFLEVNQVACQRLGYSRAEMLEMTPVDIDTPEYAALVPERVAMIHQRGHAVFETVHVRRDGAQIPVELSCRTIDYAGTPAVLTIARDITERKKAQKALARQAEALARSNADLEQFAHAVSHDLREPLRTVKRFLELLDQQYAGQLDERGRAFVSFAVDGATRMEELINGLLAYSQASSGDERIEQVDCEAIFEQVLAGLEVAIAEHGAVVTHDPLPTVPADPVQMRQLLQNLVDNGIKFHGADLPRVHVSALRRPVSSPEPEGAPQEWHFSVRDNGIGIDPAQQERIFSLFQRLHLAEEFPGVGIGLAICKRIVARHDGKMWVESTPGAGSTFHFTLPDRGERA